MENTLELKTVNSLQEFNFYIPSYQRGFRWTPKEVKDLLDDISEFRPKDVGTEGEKTWYCLQPIVVKEKDTNKFEVIDGQQRLTTIYLILHFLNQRYVNKEKLLTIEYQTRIDSFSFLKNLSPTTYSNSNVDFHFMSEAFKCITSWFNEKSDFNFNEFESKFKFDTKVIWYESNEMDSISIFTRINIGKIPLTNAELIKALFLKSSNFNGANIEKIRLKQLEISTEWDQIEQSLQNDRFWFFLNENNTSTNRIEFIFNLMNEETDIDDNYSTFRFFNKKIQR